MTKTYCATMWQEDYYHINEVRDALLRYLLRKEEVL